MATELTVDVDLNPVFIELMMFREWCAKLPQVKEPTFEEYPIIVDRFELLELLQKAMFEINRLENEVE